MGLGGKREAESENSKVGLRERLRHFTWAWFTATMSTGGLAICLAKTPHRFNGLHTIGVIVFIFAIVLFILLSSAMIARAFIDPQRFKRSFAHPAESFFFGSFWLSICVLIGAIQVYGVTEGPAGKWLVDTIRVLYWIYAGISITDSIFQYWIIMQRTPAGPIPMTPAWFLAGYPTMLTGTIAALIAPTQPPQHRMAIIVSGCAYEGFGWLISFVLIVLYINNLMQNGLPPPPLRPGMFIPVGSVAFTIVVLIGLARAIPRSYGYFETHPGAADTLQAVALFIAIFLWLFTFWLFAIAAVSCLTEVRKMRFTLPWWGFVFPNVGFTLATIDLGTELESEGILWVASGMTILVVAIWVTTLVMCVHAVVTKRIVYPGKDEDKDM